MLTTKFKMIFEVYKYAQKKGIISDLLMYDLFLDAQYAENYLIDGGTAFIIIRPSGTYGIHNKKDYENYKEFLGQGEFIASITKITDIDVELNFVLRKIMDEYFS